MVEKSNKPYYYFSRLNALGYEHEHFFQMSFEGDFVILEGIHKESLNRPFVKFRKKMNVHDYNGSELEKKVVLADENRVKYFLGKWDEAIEL